MIREVLRCPRCRLNQFVIASRLCRRCRVPLGAPKPINVTVVPPKRTARQTVGECIKDERLKRHLSQRQLAKRMNCPRTYISKIERDYCSPVLSQMTRFVRALDCSPADILPPPKPCWWEDPKLLDFMGELYSLLGGFTPSQLAELRAAAKSMVMNQISNRRIASDGPNGAITRTNGRFAGL